MIKLYNEHDQESAERLSRRGFFGLAAAAVASVVAPERVYSFSNPEPELTFCDAPTTSGYWQVEICSGGREAIGIAVRELIAKWEALGIVDSAAAVKFMGDGITVHSV